jgi:tetratricopeptide (TPR) repeat protein
MIRLFLALFTSLLLFQGTGAQTGKTAPLDAAKRQSGPEQSDLQSAELEEARQLNQKVVQLFNEGKLDEALPLAKRVVQIREKLLGKDHELVISALLNLGELTLAKQLYKESLSSYERVLKSNEKIAGPDDPSNVVLLDKMAYLSYMNSDFGDAEKLYKRALAINEKISGAQSEQFAQSAYRLAEFYRFTKSYQKAEPFYQRTLEIRDNTLKPDDEKLLRTAERFRCLYYQSDQRDKLKAFDEKRKAIYKSVNPDASVDVVNGKAVSLPMPTYPSEARAVRATGIIIIKVTIDENGQVIIAEDMCGGNSSLVKAATLAAYGARFRQTIVAGQPVKVTGAITYKFTM